jgi:hypothetical protein
MPARVNLERQRRSTADMPAHFTIEKKAISPEAVGPSRRAVEDDGGGLPHEVDDGGTASHKHSKP